MAGKNCVLGGTFTYVHAGHIKLLSACKPFRQIAIGLTSDAYVRKHKIYPSFPYAKRLAGLKAALKKLGLLSRTKIHKIDDEAGGADSMAGPDTMIVSGETLEAAKRINAKRKKSGLRSLRILSVPLVYGEDLKKISCISIYEGKTDLQGKLLKPLLIQAGTDNPTKLKGTSNALARIFGRRFILHGHSEHTGVPDHPFDEETFSGAKNRAIDAWKRANGHEGNASWKGKAGDAKCDYSIGMESGLFELKKGMHIDITACCIYDGETETYGTGMGFFVPEEIAMRIRRENSDLSAVLKEMAGVENVGRKNGAIGYFSGGLLHRKEQIGQSVLTAFVPRIHMAKAGREN